MAKTMNKEQSGFSAAPTAASVSGNGHPAAPRAALRSKGLPIERRVTREGATAD